MACWHKGYCKKLSTRHAINRTYSLHYPDTNGLLIDVIQKYKLRFVMCASSRYLYIPVTEGAIPEIDFEHHALSTKTWNLCWMPWATCAKTYNPQWRRDDYQMGLLLRVGVCNRFPVSWMSVSTVSEMSLLTGTRGLVFGMGPCWSWHLLRSPDFADRDRHTTRNCRYSSIMSEPIPIMLNYSKFVAYPLHWDVS